MKAPHMIASSSTASSAGATIHAAVKPHLSSPRLRIFLSTCVCAAPKLSSGVVCNFQARSGGRSRAAVEPSVPMRKTAKTTMFYTKPKEPPEDADAAHSESKDLPLCDLSPVPSDPEHATTDTDPAGMSQDSCTPSPAQSNISSEAVSNHSSTSMRCDDATAAPISEGPSTDDSGQGEQAESPEADSTPSVPEQPAAAHKGHATTAVSDSNVPMNTQEIDVPVQVLAKVPSRVKRPWERIPNSNVQRVPISEGGRQHRKSQAAQPSLAQDGDAAYMYLRSRGLTELQAERLSLELDGEHSQFADATVLREQLRRLDRLLPGLNVNVLLCKDTLILTTDVASAASRLVRLHALLGNPNLGSLLHVAPQLLYADDVEERVEQCIKRLLSLLPEDYDVKRLQRLLVEAPTIIFRMDHFGNEWDTITLNDLPADLVYRLTEPESKNGSICMSCLI